MLEIILVLLAVSLVIVGGTAFFIVKYYWGPGGNPNKRPKPPAGRRGA